MTADELDVRHIPKPEKHPKIFASYAALAVNESFVLVNDHRPSPLHAEFEAEYANSFGWEYLTEEPKLWRIRITKLASTPLPRILAQTPEVIASADPEVNGAVWKVQVKERDLDSNIIKLTPGAKIDAHTGPDLDVMIHVIAGSGQLATEREPIDLQSGDIVWLPRKSRREFIAGSHGLVYLTVHQRRKALTIATAQREPS